MALGQHQPVVPCAGSDDRRVSPAVAASWPATSSRSASAASGASKDFPGCRPSRTATSALHWIGTGGNSAAPSLLPGRVEQTGTGSTQPTTRKSFVLRVVCWLFHLFHQQTRVGPTSKFLYCPQAAPFEEPSVKTVPLVLRGQTIFRTIHLVMQL